MSEVARFSAERRAQRDVFGDTMVALARRDERVYLLDGDLGNSTKADRVRWEMPERFLQMGIAEQNMVGVAAGMAAVGLRPFVSSFACFVANRALDQIRVSVAQSHLPVMFVGGYSGILTGKTGKTHQSVEDLAIFRVMPNMRVVAPADGEETARLLSASLEWDGPAYFRLARDATPDIRGRAGEDAGAPRWLAQGQDVLLLSTGVQSVRALEAVSLLGDRGIDAGLVHLPVLKPFPRESLLDALRRARLVVTVEDHSVIGGLGSAVAEVVAESATPARLRRIGIADRYGEAAPNEDLLRKFGLDAESVADAVAAFVTTRSEVL